MEGCDGSVAMATCLELKEGLRGVGAFPRGLTLPTAARAEGGLGLLALPAELGRPPEGALHPEFGRGGLATPGCSKGVLAAPSALSSLPMHPHDLQTANLLGRQRL